MKHFSMFCLSVLLFQYKTVAASEFCKPNANDSVKSFGHSLAVGLNVFPIKFSNAFFRDLNYADYKGLENYKDDYSAGIGIGYFRDGKSLSIGIQAVYNLVNFNSLTQSNTVNNGFRTLQVQKKHMDHKILQIGFIAKRSIPVKFFGDRFTYGLELPVFISSKAIYTETDEHSLFDSASNNVHVFSIQENAYSVKPSVTGGLGFLLGVDHILNDRFIFEFGVTAYLLAIIKKTDLKLDQSNTVGRPSPGGNQAQLNKSFILQTKQRTEIINIICLQLKLRYSLL